MMNLEARKKSTERIAHFVFVCVWQVEWDNYSGISQTWLQSRSVRKIIIFWMQTFFKETHLCCFCFYDLCAFDLKDVIEFTVCKANVYLMVAFCKIVPTIIINRHLFVMRTIVRIERSQWKNNNLIYIFVYNTLENIKQQQNV